MIAGLHEINYFMADNIYKPMFLGNAAGPDTGAKKFKRFRFSDSLKRSSRKQRDLIQQYKLAANQIQCGIRVGISICRSACGLD